MKRRSQALDPNLDSAFASETGSTRVPSGGPPAPGRFDGEIPTYVFMRKLDADDGSAPSARLQKPERKPRERGRLEPDLPEIGSILDKYRIEIHRLENEGDRIGRLAIASLFETGDPISVIKWRKVYDVLESTIDLCEDVADILERITLKNS